MSKKKNIFLFGAGAVIDWHGPKTLCKNNRLKFTNENLSNGIEVRRCCCLTHLIRESGFKAKNGVRITNEIHKKLIKLGYEYDEINFETIINVIEEFIVYYSNYSLSKIKASVLKPFFSSKKALNNLLNFEIKNKAKSIFQLNIPDQDVFSHRLSSNNETPEQFFFQLLLIDLIDNIVAQVDEYSYHSKSVSNVIENPANKSINELFYQWIKKYNDNNISSRLYTLNYDRIFKIILKNRGINLFEGFDEPTNTTSESFLLEDGVQPNILKILTDIDSNVYYNLHGCSNWEVKGLNQNQLEGVDFFHHFGTHLNFNNGNLAITQMERGKSILVTNIITGYQKIQKTALSPFKQMQAAFDKDCVFADKLFIVGYSFGDAHINESIKTALLYNDKLEIIIIDRGFKNNKLDEKLFLEILSSGSRFNGGERYHNDKLISYDQFKTFVHIVTFKEFLEKKLYETHN